MKICLFCFSDTGADLAARLCDALGIHCGSPKSNAGLTTIHIDSERGLPQDTGLLAIDPDPRDVGDVPEFKPEARWAQQW